MDPVTKLDTFSETKREKILRAASHLYYGKTYFQAAAEAGVSEKTLRKWTKSEWWGPVWDRCEAGELEYLAALARGVARDKLLEGDGTMARFILERRDRQYAPRAKKVEIEGSVDHYASERRKLANIPTNVLEKLADGDDDVIDAYFEEQRPLLPDE